MRTKLFSSLARLVINHTGAVLLACALLTIGLGLAAGRISMKTQIVDMMPKGIPQAEEFQEIIKKFQSASTIMVAVESNDKDLKRMKACADSIARKLSSVTMVKPKAGQRLSLVQKMKVLAGTNPVPGVLYDTLQLVKRVDYKLDNGFAAHHGLMMQKPKDMRNFIGMFGSLSLPGLLKNINDNFEKEYIEDADNVATLDGESQAVQGLKSVDKFLQSIKTYLASGDTAAVKEAVRSFVTGPEYVISSDNTLLLVMIQPTVDMDNFEEGMYLGYRVVDTLTAIQRDFPGLSIGGTGWMLIQIDEMEASKKDFGWPSLVALAIILALLVGSFRTWKQPLFSMIVLVAAIIWTAGLLAIVLHYLNMMSAAFGLILIGLGIDFGIHVIAGFRDGCGQGLSPSQAISYMYNRVGNGILTGGGTTAIVFYALAFTRFEAFTEMGIAIGSGILITMFAALVLLPSLILWDVKGYSFTGNLLRKLHLGFLISCTAFLGNAVRWVFSLPPLAFIAGLFEFGFLEYIGRFIRHLPVALAVLAAGIVSMAFSIHGGLGIQFEYNMMELEPIGIPTVIVQDKILEKFEISPDYALVKSQSLDSCRSTVEAFKKIGNRTDLIGQVDAVTELIPAPSDQEANVPLITKFAASLARTPVEKTFTKKDLESLIKELERLHQNIVEIGELSVMSSGEKNKIIRTCDQIAGRKDDESSILALAHSIKALEGDPAVLAPFQEIMGTVLKGRLQSMASTEPITLANLPEDIRSRYVSPVNGELLISVYPKALIWEERNLRRFNEETTRIAPRITGTPAIMMLFIDLMKEKGLLAVIISAIAILIFLLADFRSLKLTLLAIIPLAVGSVWMVGLMALMGIKFNIANFIALPLILGIGIDDGVHILHRYLKEGKGSIPLVLRYTGKAILLTSLTTMIGFGSMGLASHRGTASMGQVLFLGVGTCFLSSVTILPALITLIEYRRKK